MSDRRKGGFLLETEYLNGKRVFITNMITKDMQARKHRKKRINKKWLKQYGHKAVSDDAKVYMTNDAIFMTRRCFKRLKKQIELNKAHIRYLNMQ